MAHRTPVLRAVSSHDAVDVRIARSRRALVDAMLALLREGEGSGLTISTICSRAGVSRSTFYQHFSSPDALLSAAVADRLDGVVAGHSNETMTEGATIIAAVLAELDAEGAAGAYRATLKDITVIRRLQATLEAWIADRLWAAYPQASPTRVDFAAGGVTRVLAHWIDWDEEHTPDRYPTRAKRPSAHAMASEIWCLVETIIGPIPSPDSDPVESH